MSTIIIKKQRTKNIGIWRLGKRYDIPNRPMYTDYEIKEDGTTKYIRTTSHNLQVGTVIDLDVISFTYRDSNGNLFGP